MRIKLKLFSFRRVFHRSSRAFPSLHKKFDVDINNRGVFVYVNE